MRNISNKVALYILYFPIIPIILLSIYLYFTYPINKFYHEGQYRGRIDRSLGSDDFIAFCESENEAHRYVFLYFYMDKNGKYDKELTNLLNKYINSTDHEKIKMYNSFKIGYSSEYNKFPAK